MAAIDKTVNVESLADAIASLTEEYGSEVADVLEESVKEVAKEARDKAKQNAPVNTGKYKRSLSVKQTGTGNTPAYVVYAKAPEYRRAHLLEHGHRTTSGGMVGKYPHFKPAEDYAKEKLPERIREKLEK